MSPGTPEKVILWNENTSGAIAQLIEWLATTEDEKIVEESEMVITCLLNKLHEESDILTVEGTAMAEEVLGDMVKLLTEIARLYRRMSVDVETSSRMWAAVNEGTNGSLIAANVKDVDWELSG